jgi:monoamine oxidase
MKPEERVRWALEYLAKVHPGFAENFEGGTSFSWIEEPWSLGAWAYYAPGEVAALYPHVASPEGRIHFAGEHTTMNMTMEGCGSIRGKGGERGVECAGIMRRKTSLTNTAKSC